MGLEAVLLRSIGWAVVSLGGLATLGAWIGQGPSTAAAVGSGVVLSGASGAALASLVTRLLDPRSANKGALGAMLALKFGGVLGAAWFMLKAVDPSGFAFGLVTGVLAVVFGVQSGQGSPAGQAAIEAQERQIAQDEEAKKTPDSRPKNR